jgi:hypothetical protein
LGRFSESAGGSSAKLVFAIAGLAIAGIILFVVVPWMNRPSSAGSAPLNALGQITAEETMKLLNNSGRIVVIGPDPVAYVVSPALKDRLTAFEQVLKKSAITLEATEIPPMDEASGQCVISPSLYSSFVGKYPDIDAIVSFVGAPLLTAKDLRSLPKKMPKFLALSLTDTPLKPLFRAGVIQVAIVNRLEPAPVSSSTPKSAREFFDQSYQVITSDNASSLPN